MTLPFSVEMTPVMRPGEHLGDALKHAWACGKGAANAARLMEGNVYVARLLFTRQEPQAGPPGL